MLKFAGSSQTFSSQCQKGSDPSSSLRESYGSAGDPGAAFAQGYGQQGNQVRFG
jgi:hypothetical protein